MPAAKRQRIAQRFQYRLLWQYTGSRKVHEFRADKAATVLNMLRRVATEAPWMGVNRSVLRKAWARLCFRLNVPFDAIGGLGPREVVQRIQDSFPRLEWVRVEHRQVGDWVQTIDPLNTLRTPASSAADARTQKLFDEISEMSPEALDKWRTRVTDEYRIRERKTAANNRELVRPEDTHVG